MDYLIIESFGWQKLGRFGRLCACNLFVVFVPFSR